MSSRVIGLTGPSGAGKSTVARAFADAGITVIDADLTAREATATGSPLLENISEAFGDEIILSDGSLDRRRLADIAFSSREKTELLNSITHPYIIELIRHRIDSLEGTVLLDAPTLFESGADSLCDLIIAVIAERSFCISRIMERDGLTRDQALARIKAQHPVEFYADRADIVIKNDGTLDDLYKSAADIIARLKSR